MPDIVLDYAFLGGGGGGERDTVVVLVIRDRRTQMLFANAVPRKGLRGVDGRTAYERMEGNARSGEMVEFGEKIHSTIPKRHRTSEGHMGWKVRRRVRLGDILEAEKSC